MSENGRGLKEMEEWMGYFCRKFAFEEHEAIVVFPKSENRNGYLAVKTEYWNAFPEAAFRLRLWSGSAHLHGSGKGRYYL